MTPQTGPQTRAADSSTVDPAEVAKFSAMAEDWWDPEGKFRPLHRLNPTRLAYIRDRAVERFGGDARALRPLDGLRVLDIGCGGGLVAEPLARLGARVTGIDAAEANVKVAALHAAQAGLEIDYRHVSAEDLARSGAQFDLVLALEVVEHVADVPAFLKAVGRLVRPGGAVVLSTLNRSARAFALAIVGAEYVLRWLPRGTHDWRRFLRPSELAAACREAGLTPRDLTGLVYNPLTDGWRLDRRDLGVNYLLYATREA